jgi:hypothetical protein
MATLRPSFTIPKDIAMLASAFYSAGEQHPTVDLVVYHKGFDAGDADDRLVGKADFRGLRIRQFLPGWGCEVQVENGEIVGTEPGLQNFVGKKVSIYNRTPGNPRYILLVAWEGEVPADDGIGMPHFYNMIDRFEGLMKAFV